MSESIRQQAKVWKWRPPTGTLIVSGLVVGLFCFVILTVLSVLAPAISSLELEFSLHEIAGPWVYSFKIAIYSCLLCMIAAPIVAWSCWQIKMTLKLQNQNLGQLMVLPYCLPTVAVGAMIVLAFGNSGAINRMLYAELKIIDQPIPFLYQDWSPLLGTVWMNLSLGVMLLLKQWTSIPTNYFRQAELMQLPPGKRLRWIVIPFSKSALLPWLGVVFLSCFNSFGLMLILSGSPSATTIELATWQSLYMEANWTKAALLMILQLLSSTLIVLILWRGLKATQAHQTSGGSQLAMQSENREQMNKSKNIYSVLTKALAWIVSGIFAAFYLVPFLALAVDAGVFLYSSSSSTEHFHEIFDAIFTSSINGVICASFTVLVVMYIVPTQQRSQGYRRFHLAKWFGLMMWLPAIVPGMVPAFALLAVSSYLEWSGLKLPGIWFIQALLAIPVAAALYWSGWMTNLAPNFRIREELGLSSAVLWKRIEIPAMWSWATTSAAIAASLSFGDVTVVSLLADNEHPPLTILLARLMGTYRFGEASMVIFVLVCVSGILFFASTRRLRGVSLD